jgi:hypothetical protein
MKWLKNKIRGASRSTSKSNMKFKYSEEQKKGKVNLVNMNGSSTANDNSPGGKMQRSQSSAYGMIGSSDFGRGNKNNANYAI